MDASFWRERWDMGQIGFHSDKPHADLMGEHGAWLHGGRRVLVPLCGKSVDLPWLAQRIETVGVELAEKAVRAMHDEHNLQARVEQAGGLAAWRTPNLTVLQGDVFDLGADHVSGVDRVWDRAALVALDPDRRRRYVAHLRDLLPAGTRILLNVLVYDQQVMSGPPHSLSDSEVRHLYRGASVEQVDVCDMMNPRWREAGHTVFNRVLYRIEL